MSDIGSSSPTTRLDSVSEEPAAHTKSMRSNTSHGEMPGWPDVHVKPGSVTASGCTSRNESRNPAFSITTEVGHRTEKRGARYRRVVGCQPSAFTTRGVQSRHDGALKSPVKNTGSPAASCGASESRNGCIHRTRTWRSICRISAFVAVPNRIMSTV